jgi:hypothetical protein
MKMIVVLPDGETWSVLEGCKIVVISNGEYEDICEDRVSIVDGIVPTIEVDLSGFVANIQEFPKGV